MRPFLLLLPLLLAACATPRETCIAEATRDLRVINALVAQTRANLERGYAIAEDEDLRTLYRTCRVENADGTTGVYTCPTTQVVTREVPVAIDLNAERAKLESLVERQAQLESAVQPALRQCMALYPQ